MTEISPSVPQSSAGAPAAPPAEATTPPSSPASSPDTSAGVDQPAAASLKQVLRSQMVIGGLVIFGFFGVLGGWAATAPLAGAAIAPGIVSPDIGRRTLQHLEGGIVREILVHDGSQVAAGERLLVLDEAQARATYQYHRGRMIALTAQQARLEARQAGSTEVEFPPWLLAEAEKAPQVARILEGQVNQFLTRTHTADSQRRILTQRIAQLREEILGLEAMVSSQDVQLGLIAEEIQGVQTLVNRGLERKPRLLSLQRQRADILGRRAENTASIARARQSIGESESRILAQDAEMLDRSAAELEQVRGELGGVLEQVAAAEDVMKRLDVVAPVSGTVVNMAVTTLGAVIAPGEPILDIVPAEEDLLIDARLAPNDVDVVRIGQRAEVHLTAYSQRNLPRINGELTYVSADSLIDETDGQRYFEARVRVDADQLAALGDEIRLMPGMPAEAMILTGERTALDYLLQPMLDTMRRGMREQ